MSSGHLPAASLKWNTQHGLRGWIEDEYGVEKTQMLLANTLLERSEEEQLKVRVYLIWYVALCFHMF